MGKPASPQAPSWLGFAFGSEAVAPVPTGLAKKLQEAGIAAGFKPAMPAILKAKPLLEEAAGQEAGCILAAWLGGAHDAANWYDFGDEVVSFSAQTACGVSKLNQVIGFGYLSVEDALELLADKEAADLVRSAGKATAKKSVEGQKKNAEDDAVKLGKDLLNAVTPEGFGSALSAGAGIAIGVVVLVVAYKLLK